VVVVWCVFFLGALHCTPSKEHTYYRAGYVMHTGAIEIIQLPYLEPPAFFEWECFINVDYDGPASNQFYMPFHLEWYVGKKGEEKIPVVFSHTFSDARDSGSMRGRTFPTKEPNRLQIYIPEVKYRKGTAEDAANQKKTNQLLSRATLPGGAAKNEAVDHVNVFYQCSFVPTDPDGGHHEQKREAKTLQDALDKLNTRLAGLEKKPDLKNELDKINTRLEHLEKKQDPMNELNKINTRLEHLETKQDPKNELDKINARLGEVEKELSSVKPGGMTGNYWRFLVPTLVAIAVILGITLLYRLVLRD